MCSPIHVFDGCLTHSQARRKQFGIGGGGGGGAKSKGERGLTIFFFL